VDVTIVNDYYDSDISIIIDCLEVVLLSPSMIILYIRDPALIKGTCKKTIIEMICMIKSNHIKLENCYKSTNDDWVG